MVKANKKALPKWVVRTETKQGNSRTLTKYARVLTRFGKPLGIEKESLRFVQIDDASGDGVISVNADPQARVLLIDDTTWVGFNDEGQVSLEKISTNAATLLPVEQSGAYGIKGHNKVLTTDKHGVIGLRDSIQGWEEFTLSK